MLVTINIKKTINKNNKSRSQRTYFYVCNVYVEQLLSLVFSLKRFASHELTKL